MTLGYRTVFTVRDRRDEVIPIVQGQLYAWLRGKRLDGDRAEIGRQVRLKPNVMLTLQELSGRDESQTFRARLEEFKDNGTWTSTLTTHIPGDGFRDPWVWIDIDAPEGTPWTGRPRIAADLLDVMDAYDGATALKAVPEVVSAEELDTLIALLQDPARRQLVFVAGSDDGMPIPRWTDLLKNLLRETVGLACTYVMDSEATSLLQQQLGARFAVAPGTVRTYAPRLDVDDPDDAIRHRILGTRRIVQSDPRTIARALGEPARSLVTAQPLPKTVTRVDHLLERQLDEILLGMAPAAATPATRPVTPQKAKEGATTLLSPTAATSDYEPRDQAVEVAQPDGIANGGPAEQQMVGETDEQAGGTQSAASADLAIETEAFLALREGLRDLLGVDVPSADAVTQLTALARLGQDVGRRTTEVSQRLAAVRQQLAVSEERHTELARRHEDELVEHAVTANALRRAEADARHLREVLRTVPDADIWTPADEELTPEDFDQLLELAGMLDGIDISAVDPATARGLDTHESLGVWAGKAWDILRALSDYTKAKAHGECDRDVDGYLRNTPTGYRTYPANRHARDESRDVQNNDAFRDRRVFRVPASVVHSGKVFMGAHFRIAQYGLISPRLHYYDATSIDGRVYVGYIGPHLPTKQTN